MRFYPMLEVVLSHRFKRDLRVAKRRGCPLDKLEEVVNTLAQQLPLAEKYRDHSLAGEYKGFRECHIEPDWLPLPRGKNSGGAVFISHRATRRFILKVIG